MGTGAPASIGSKRLVALTAAAVPVKGLEHPADHDFHVTLGVGEVAVDLQQNGGQLLGRKLGPLGRLRCKGGCQGERRGEARGWSRGPTCGRPAHRLPFC